METTPVTPQDRRALEQAIVNLRSCLDTTADISARLDALEGRRPPERPRLIVVAGDREEA